MLPSSERPHMNEQYLDFGMTVAAQYAHYYNRRFQQEEFNDIYSDALFGLAIALKNITGLAGTKTYTRIKIRGYILDGIFNRRKQSSHIDRFDNLNDINLINYDYDESELVVAIKKHLTGRERDVMLMLCKDSDAFFVAKKIGVCEGTISRIRRNAINKLQEVGLNVE